VEYGFDRWELRNIQQPLLNINFEMLMDAKRLLPVFAFEFRKPGAFIKKIVVGNIQATQRLLKRLRINIFQPLTIWLLFHVSHHSGSISVRQPLLFGAFVDGKKINSFSQESIVDEPTRSKMLREQHFLGFVRVKPEFERFIDYHVLHLNYFICNVNNYF